jgi:streptomycin 6-kinase
VDLPTEPVRNKAVTYGATEWLDDLPATVASLEADWSITIGRAFDDATEAYVVEATMEDGTPAVLKVLLPHDLRAEREIDALRLADGDGLVQLLRDDPGRHALLLERLGRTLVELDRPILERHDILCAVAARVWRPAPEANLPTGAEKGRWLVDSITTTWERLGRPCTEAAVDDAVACAEHRIAAHDDERAVLVHGDVHQWNTLQAGDGFKLVDPDGLLAEPEYDLGIIMREDPLELLAADPTERARRLAARTGLDATAIWEWGVVERLSTGLLCVEIELEPVGDQMLRTAEAVAGLDAR